MLRIVKNREPNCLDNYRKKNKEYKDILVEDKVIIKNSLYDEQKELCAYCCRSLKNCERTIEHIVPQSLNSKLSIDYNNMLLCCNCKRTCNSYKKNKYDEKLFISPLDDKCEEYFEFNIYTGEILPSKILDDIDKQKAEYTINILNLNYYPLIVARANIVKLILNLDKTYIAEYYNNYPYFDVIKYYTNM